MFAVFTMLELRTKDPIVRLSMFRNRGVLDASITAIFIGFCMFLMFQTLPFFLETPKAAGGFFGITDTFVIGLYMFPSAIAQLIFGPMGGIMSKKVGADKVLIAGLAIMALGFVTLVFMHTDWVGIVISMFIAGAGMALCMVSMINLVVVTCKQSEFGVASGMNTLFRVVGGVGRAGPGSGDPVELHPDHPGPSGLHRERLCDHLDRWSGLLADRTGVCHRPSPEEGGHGVRHSAEDSLLGGAPSRRTVETKPGAASALGLDAPGPSCLPTP